ncbi:BREX system P-loop protein BrxC [Spirosoma validum]|uniref:BREX system P-loop protein BrxC n=1 Tax=Spirosoma validum TaxID=2771355 RepID=A0A927GGQ3_9BACT|nr:BREX system P-loop protein BrxC [Spirosoma validum]MBD2757119.1 BREX system P-loop protein BrxC [Spirosoma validum]
MILQDSFAKPIGRPIETVIKADDTSHVEQEVNEYVITQELSKKLEIFFAAYKDTSPGVVANGVWISGFFGSGKSHLLKILSYVLENKTYDGRQIGQVFADKAQDNALLRADILNAVRIPSCSILFNIDQKADVISKQQPDAILSVFYKVFNDFIGYYGAQGHVADFERALDRQGNYEAFKEAIQDLTGRSWTDIRMDYAWEEDAITQALARVRGNQPDDNRNVLDTYHRDYKLSVDDFCQRVQDYIASQPKGFRLNFFVDEIGQYIADNSKLMLNLQTIAETLATRTKGQSWVLVTAQEDMAQVIGDMNQRQENDFSRIQARFATRLSLTSANVDEVIQKRLLEKTAAAKVQLELRYETDRHNLQTVFQFVESRVFKGFRNEADFVDKYPFLPYQFDLFQSTIRGLSTHNAFQGKHASVGERSMLGVFQLVVLQMANGPIGPFVTFDRLFDGISSTIRGETQASITQATKQLDNDLAKQVLRALFMVKYVKEFKANLRNISILLTGDLTTNLKAHELTVLEALNLLEAQTYIQRNGDTYEFLTDEEKDIENEIKAVKLELGADNRLLSDLLFGEIVKDAKIRYQLNKQDYDYTQKIDGVTTSGRERELAINMLTPNFENYDNEALIGAHSMGVSTQLFCKLAPDMQLLDDVRMYLKTDTYIRQNNSSAATDTTRRIISEKGTQNSARRRALQVKLNRLLADSKIWLNGSVLDLGVSGEGRNRINAAAQELIRVAYPNLTMLGDTTYSEEAIKTTLNSRVDDLFRNDDSALGEAERDLLATLKRRKQAAERTTVNDLLTHFNRKPYGWYPAATLTLIARLYKRGKLEGRLDANLLADTGMKDSLTNSRLFDKTLLEPQEDFEPSKVKKLRDLYTELFDEQAPTIEAKELAIAFQKRARELKMELDGLRASSGQYAFLNALAPVTEQLGKLSQKEYAYLVNQSGQFADTLLDAKEDLIAPIRTFWNGPQKGIFDRLREFIKGDQSNFSYIDSAELNRLKTIFDSPNPFAGNLMQEAKAAMDVVADKVKAEREARRQQATNAVQQCIERLQQHEDFAGLLADQQRVVLKPLNELLEEIKHQRYIGTIESLAQRAQQKLTEQLNVIVRLAHSPAVKTQPANGKPDEETPASSPSTQVSSQPSPATATPDRPPVTYPVPAQEPVVTYVNRQSVTIDFAKPELKTEDDVDAYVEAMRASLKALIQQNKRISL